MTAMLRLWRWLFGADDDARADAQSVRAFAQFRHTLGQVAGR